jgi:hypothetical protein
LLDPLVDIWPTGAMPHPDRSNRAIVEHNELDLCLASAVADHRQGQQVVVLLDKRMHIGEVLVTGGRRPGYLDSGELLGSGFLG